MRRERQDIKAKKTINQLKSSIDSIEKMIEKSQQILKSTRPLQPRQVRSDSIELRFNSQSRSKSKSREKEIVNQSQYFTQPSTNFAGSHQVLDKCISKQRIIKLPQKTRPIRSIQALNYQEQLINFDNSRTNDKILISDDERMLSPISMAQNKHNQYFLDSSLESIQPKKWVKQNRKMKTEAINDSWEQSFNNSFEKKSEKGSQWNLTNKEQSYRTIGPKRIILRKKNNDKISNQKQLQMIRNKSKSHKIFPKTSKQGKYSYYKQVNPNNLNEKSKQTNTANRQNSYRFATISSTGQTCQKHKKETNQMNLNQFLKKVKNYGFVERYLTQTQICCIYQYLRKTSIPEYKWPLYVVDEVYEKMNNALKIRGEKLQHLY